MLATIGTGSFGTCRKIQRKSDGKVFVWKEIDYGGMSEKEKQLLVQEVNLLRELRHPHIVRYHDRIIDRSESTLYIIMEYCQGGDLASLITKARQERRYLEESYIWRIFHQLLLALKECHEKREGVHKILHRDLKPANVFLDEGRNVKLGDFGLARILHHNFSLAKTFVGSPYYMSPEQFTEEMYDEKSDLWSLGCLVYELCALSPPFTAPNQRLLAIKVKEAKLKPIPSHFSASLQRNITALLHAQPSKRPDVDTLLQQVAPHVASREQPVAARVQREPSKVISREELLQREAELRQYEEKLRSRERAISERERRLDARERVLEERERLVQQLEKLHLRYPLETVDTNCAANDH